MLSAWVAIGLYLPQEHQRVFPILLVSASESNDSFPGEFFFHGLFWNTTEAATWGGVLWKKVSFKISQNSKPPASNFIKKETLAQVFSCKICEIFKNTFFYRIPPVAASGSGFAEV